MAGLAAAAALRETSPPPPAPAAVAPGPPTVADWTERGWRDVEIEPLALAAAGDTRVTHAFAPAVVVFRNAGWDRGAVVAAMQRAADAFAAGCGLGIRGATLVTAAPPTGSPDISKDKDALVAARTPPGAGAPALYFVGTDENGATAYSYNRAGCNGIGCDTAWISRDVDSARYRDGRDPGYSPVAHELAHILGVAGHNFVGDRPLNILGANPKRRNSTMTAAQCASFIAHPAVTALAAP